MNRTPRAWIIVTTARIIPGRICAMNRTSLPMRSKRSPAFESSVPGKRLLIPEAGASSSSSVGLDAQGTEFILRASDYSRMWRDYEMKIA
jgi:hypothetical protein